MKTHIQNWISRRFKFDGIKQIRQKDILIFIYQQGYLYLVLILITFIAGINYANNLILGFCFLISSILCLSFYLTFKQLHTLKVEMITPEIGRVDEILKIRFEISQHQKAPKYLHLKVEEEISRIQLSDRQTSIEIEIRATQRGAFHLPRITLYSTYPLGLVRAWTYFHVHHAIWIAPKPLDFQQDSQHAQSTGQPDQDEFKELRSYQLGDSFQSISWKQAARGQGLYVKQFEDQKDLNVVHIDYERMPSTDHEEKLSLMMGLIDQCEQAQQPYSLILGTNALEKGNGDNQYLKAQLLLAQVE